MRTKDEQAIKVAKGEVLVVKPNRPMSAAEFEILAEQVKVRNAKSEVEIVLLPFSAEIVGTQKKETPKTTKSTKKTSSDE